MDPFIAAQRTTEDTTDLVPGRLHLEIADVLLGIWVPVWALTAVILYRMHILVSPPGSSQARKCAEAPSWTTDAGRPLVEQTVADKVDAPTKLAAPIR